MKKSITAIILTVFCVVAVAASIGVSAAVWTDAGGESGIAPSANTTDWNVYAKYVTFETSGSNASITGWSGTLLEDMVFPSEVMVGDVPYTVTSIRNTVFSSSTMKSVPVSVWIPSTVTYVDEHTFSGLTNLRTMYFGGAVGNSDIIKIGQYAFAGCSSLSDIVFQTSTAANFETHVCFRANAFLGCNNLVTFNSSTGDSAQYDQIYIYYSTSNTRVDSSNYENEWVNFKTHTALTGVATFPFEIPA